MTDGQFLRIRRLRALAVVRLKFSQELGRVVVIVGSPGSLGEQLLPSDQARSLITARVRDAARRDPQTEVLLRADSRVPYGRVAELIGWVQDAGLSRIGFVTETPR